MALELMPDGKTFKKLNSVQEKALKRYYKRLHDKPLSQNLALPISIGALAYILKDKLKIPDLDIPDVKTLIEETGGIVADAIVQVEGALFPQNPINPEYVILNEGTPQERKVGPFSRCSRWELDATDWLTVKQSYKGDLGYFETTLGALTASRIIKNMKREGCSKPTVFSQAQWDDI